MKQWTYIRYDRSTSRRFFNCPCLVVYANDILGADKQFESITGVKPAKLAHIGVSAFPVSHVDVGAKA